MSLLLFMYMYLAMQHENIFAEIYIKKKTFLQKFQYRIIMKISTQAF